MEGYSKLASLMGTYSDTLIFRHFGALSAQNLLYLQAELVHLEHELRECITVLYIVASMPIRLGLVAVFTVVFTFLCGFLTSAKAIEIFAATTA